METSKHPKSCKDLRLQLGIAFNFRRKRLKSLWDKVPVLQPPIKRGQDATHLLKLISNLLVQVSLSQYLSGSAWGEVEWWWPFGFRGVALREPRVIRALADLGTPMIEHWFTMNVFFTVILFFTLVMWYFSFINLVLWYFFYFGTFLPWYLLLHQTLVQQVLPINLPHLNPIFGKNTLYWWKSEMTSSKRGTMTM